MSAPIGRSPSPLSLNQILEALEDPDFADYTSADIYICPPDNDPNHLTDEDSGDEDACQDPDRLSHCQLSAEAEIKLRGSNTLDNDTLASDDEQVASESMEIEDNQIEESKSLNTDNQIPQCSTSTSRKRKLSNSTKQSSYKTPKTKNVRKVPNPKVKKGKEVPNRKWEKGDLKKNNDENMGPNRDKKSKMGPLITTLTNESHPLEFFECFMPPDLVEAIVKFSVTYAVQKNFPNFELGVDEFYTFLGILYLTGYVPLPRKRMYWENSEDVHNTMVSNSMRRNRFDEILRFVHFCNNDNIKLDDKMAKIRPILDQINSLFLHFAPAEDKVSVDESMIPYFGRHSCKQFIKGKPIRFGFKAWVLAARTGYCIQTDIYQGRKGSDSTPDGLGLGERVVLEFSNILSLKYPDVKFNFYIDNFFTSPKLIAKLGEQGMSGTGTVRSNRTEQCPLPDKKSMKARERGTFESFIDKEANIVAVTWKDNSIVSLLSNEHGVMPLGEAKRYSMSQKKKITIPQPSLIAHYNRNMGGVDLMDNNVSNYRIAVRGKRWYMPIVMWLFDVVMSNSWFLARAHGITLDSLGFRRSVVQAMLQKYGRPPKATGPTKVLKRSTDPQRKHHGGHLIVTGQKRRRCAVCRNKTVKACQRCEVPLHDTCFAEYHIE